MSVMGEPDGLLPHGTPPAPREVTVVGTAPPSWRDRQVTGGVLAVLWTGVLFCALAGPTWLTISLSVVLAIATALYVVGTWSMFSIIDDPEIKAGPDGIWAPDSPCGGMRCVRAASWKGSSGTGCWTRLAKWTTTTFRYHW